MKLAKIALRNLSRQKRRSLLLAGAIAVGILIVTMVNSFSAGTVHVIKENMSDVIGGHVFVTMQHKEGDKTINVINDDHKLVAALHRLNIKDEQIAKTIDMDGSLLFSGKESMLTLIGTAWNAGSDMQQKLGMSASDFAKAVSFDHGVILNKKTADTLGVSQGDTVLFKCKTVSGQQNVGDFTVSYITGNSSETGGMVAFADKEVVNQLANLPSPISYLYLRIKLPALDMAPAFAKQLETELAKDNQVAPKTDSQFGMVDNIMHVDTTTEFSGERVQVTTINDMLSMVSDLADGIAIASVVMLVILLAITMLGITNTFRMILYERIREIGTMRAVGMHRGEVRRLMLYEASFLSLLGVALGVGLAGIGMIILGMIDFGVGSTIALFLSNGHLSFLLDPASLLVSLILVVAFTVIAALGPAGKAAKLSPAEAMRSN